MLSLSGENSRVIDSILKEAMDSITKEKNKLIEEHPVTDLRSFLLEDAKISFGNDLNGIHLKKYNEWFSKIILMIKNHLGTNSVHEAFEESTSVDLNKLREYTKQTSILEIDDGKNNFKKTLLLGKLPDGTPIANIYTEDYAGYGTFDHIFIPSNAKVKDISSASDEEQIKKIIKDVDFIKKIKNPSKKVQMAFIEKWPWFLRYEGYIKNPSQEMMDKAFKLNPTVIEIFKNQSEEMQLDAVKRDLNAFQYIKNPTKKVQLYVLQHSKEIWEDLKNSRVLNQEIVLEAFKKSPRFIKFIKNPTKKQILHAFDSEKFSKNPGSMEIDLEWFDKYVMDGFWERTLGKDFKDFKLNPNELRKKILESTKWN